MSSAATTVAVPGGRPQGLLPARTPITRRGLGSGIVTVARGGLQSVVAQASALIPAAVAPEPEKKKFRVYLLKDMVDRATVEVALSDQLERAQLESPFGFYTNGVINTTGTIYIGFTGAESRILSREEFVDFVLADKNVAAQFFLALEVKPVPASVHIELLTKINWFTVNKLKAPTTAEYEAASKKDLENLAVFPLKKLPAEMRRLIYHCSDIFALRHDGKLPPFVEVAMLDKYLKPEVTDLFKKRNYLLTLANEPAFLKLKMDETEIIEHMYFQWGDL